MLSESLPLSFLFIFSLISFFVFFITLNISKKIDKNIILDTDFSKPQAFHKYPVPRCGGIASVIAMMIFFVLYYAFFQKLFFELIFLSFFLFLLGFLDDIKIRLNPNTRLVLMIFTFLFFIIFFSTNLSSIDLPILDKLMKNSVFSSLFVLLCFLFVTNGANLIDGFNGLLTIHLLLINFIILFLNVSNGHEETVMAITGQIIVLFLFLLFNFPKAKMFLGDSGSYLFGSLTALNIIKTNNLNPEISSFFFCIILFYIFFEVFFSFFRKLLQKKHPLKPDENHLHMLLFKRLKTSIKNTNSFTGLIINLMYFLFILPALFNMNNPMFCVLWFFALLGIYIFVYLILYKYKKNSAI